MARSRRHLSGPVPIGDVVESWLDQLAGPARLNAFHRLPESMQRGAMQALREAIEAEREAEDAS